MVKKISMKMVVSFCTRMKGRWLLYIYNLLLLQHHATSGNIKSLRWWWCLQCMHF